MWQKVFARQLTFIDQKHKSRKTRVRITSNCSFKFTKHAIPYNINLMISKIANHKKVIYNSEPADVLWKSTYGIQKVAPLNVCATKQNQ